MSKEVGGKEVTDYDPQFPSADELAKMRAAKPLGTAIDERVLRALERSRDKGVRRTTVGAIAHRLRIDDPVKVLGAVERLQRTKRGRVVIGRGEK